MYVFDNQSELLVSRAKSLLASGKVGAYTKSRGYKIFHAQLSGASIVDYALDYQCRV